MYFICFVHFKMLVCMIFLSFWKVWQVFKILLLIYVKVVYVFYYLCFNCLYYQTVCFELCCAYYIFCFVYFVFGVSIFHLQLNTLDFLLCLNLLCTLVYTQILEWVESWYFVLWQWFALFGMDKLVFLDFQCMFNLFFSSDGLAR